MTLNEWKARLTPAGTLFGCYFVIPFIAGLFMGANDAIYGRVTFSVLIQAGFGVAVILKLFSLKQELLSELAFWLKKFAQPPERTLALAEKIALAARFLIVVAMVWPPAGEILAGSRLLTLLKVCVLGGAGYLGYGLWKLAEPFLAYVPVPAPPADDEAPVAKAEQRRCVKCGQLLPETGEFCTFCWHHTGQEKP